MNAITKTIEPEWEEIHAIPIEARDEPLVPLSLYPEKILVRSAYFQAQILGSFPECYAREEVQRKLFQVAEQLPSNLRLVILDGWRSAELQTTLFGHCVNYYRKHNPEMNDEELSQLARQFVALPSTSPATPSPHLTGGAIDLLLADQTGRMLDFGSPFDHAGEISCTRYFEELQEKRELNGREIAARDNRRLLYDLMINAGFINYHQEWWHFEFGTQQWALKKGEKKAFYGPASLVLQPFSIESGS